VTQAGPADGKLVLLLHGFPDFWYGWRQQIAPLAQAGFHVVVPDQRGYNLSDKPNGVPAYQIGRLAKDVIGLLDALGVQEACIAGHDWGAAVAWETAMRYPERVKKLAILNVPHPDVMQRHLRGSWGQMRKSWYIFFFQIPWLPEAMLSGRGYGNLIQLLKRSGKAGTFDERDLPAYIQAWSQPGALTAMINWYRAVLRGGVTSTGLVEKKGARRVKPPALILWGKRDVALSSEMVQPSLELCDQGRLVFFDQATHWVQLDEAGAVTHHLLEFFADEG
jgi:pimeloyl-ACP methyl ester carboxylesterase